MKDVNGRLIEEGDVVRDLSREDLVESEVFADDDGDLYIIVDGTAIHLSEIETEVYTAIVWEE